MSSIGSDSLHGPVENVHESEPVRKTAPRWPVVCIAAGLLSIPALSLPLLHLMLVVVAGVAALVAARDGGSTASTSRTPRLLCRIGLATAVASLAIAFASCATDAF